MKNRPSVGDTVEFTRHNKVYRGEVVDLDNRNPKQETVSVHYTHPGQGYTRVNIGECTVVKN